MQLMDHIPKTSRDRVYHQTGLEENSFNPQHGDWNDYPLYF